MQACWVDGSLSRSAAREFAQSHKGCQPVAEGRAPQAAAPAPEAELEGDLRRALAAVEKIKREPSAHWFRAPVPKAVAPDYADVIERPMDLGTLAMGIRQGKYGSVGEVYADLRLIWSNCIEYNGEDHDIVGVMRKVEAKAEQIWDDMSLSRGGE